MKNEKLFISFAIKIDEMLRFSCRTTNNDSIADKEIFRVDDYYFFYVFNRTEKVNTYSLREITEKEFNARRKEFLKLKPNKTVSEWTDGKNKFSVKNYHHGFWRKNVPTTDCLFLTEDNPLKEIHDAVVCEASVRKAQTEAYNREEKYEYARKCGGLGRKLGIAYVNVMRLGPEKGKLMKFKESYERAIAKTETMKLKELRSFYGDLFRRGRASRKQAMDILGIQYFEADVNLLVLTELEQAMSERLNSYVTESVKQAKNNAINADYPTRQQMYNDLMGSSRRQKREVLTRLGVNVDAIEMNKYPLSEIKRALAATLGCEMEG